MESVDCEVKVIGGLRSPFVARVRIALKLKNVEFKLLEEKLGKKSDILLKSNPILKLMPVLLHYDKPICESLVIIRYIDEVWMSNGPPILPSDPFDRAIVCFWANYVDQTWVLSLNEVLTSNLKEEEANPEALKQVEEGLILLEDVFNKINKGKPYFSGQDWIGFLDIAFGCFLYRLKVLEKMNNVNMLNESKTPGLARWSEKFLDDSVVKSILVGVDETMELFKLIAKMMLDNRVPVATDSSVTTTTSPSVNNTATDTIALPVDNCNGITDHQVNNSVPVATVTSVTTTTHSVNNTATTIVALPVNNGNGITNHQDNNSDATTRPATIVHPAENIDTTTTVVVRTGNANTVGSVASVEAVGVVRG